MNIGNATLLFLAGVWSSNETSTYIDQDSATLRHSVSAAALHHARAFITAHHHGPAGKGDKDYKQIDFQVIFPSVLIALQSFNRAVRDAGVALISAMATSSNGSKSREIYAYDAAYQQSCEL